MLHCECSALGTLAGMIVCDANKGHGPLFFSIGPHCRCKCDCHRIEAVAGDAMEKQTPGGGPCSTE